MWQLIKEGISNWTMKVSKLELSMTSLNRVIKHPKDSFPSLGSSLLFFFSRSHPTLHKLLSFCFFLFFEKRAICFDVSGLSTFEAHIFGRLSIASFPLIVFAFLLKKHLIFLVSRTISTSSSSSSLFVVALNAIAFFFLLEFSWVIKEPNKWSRGKIFKSLASWMKVNLVSKISEVI